jgi:cytochrome c553
VLSFPDYRLLILSVPPPRHDPRFRLIVALFLAAGPLSATGAEPLRFNRDIRPILSENCFQCHGPDQDQRKAKLRLDRRDDALAVGAFEPGKPAESALIERIFAGDPEEQMPPADSNRHLTVAQKEMLRQWIAEGAEYEPHWGFVAPVRPAPPVLKSPSPTPNPIDAFILAGLEREGLAPAPEANRRTLIRRLSLDLTGLPPASGDVEDFVRSRNPRAYEELVAKYLASPHYGERMAIPWLDLVRYADTVGFHNDVPIRVWPYRDYVINAFNRNLPFDQFTREQLAGDLLPGSTITQRVASGYNRLHRISAEGGIQDKEYYAKYAADRVRTTATVWLGTTMACAECHDHKFDPFTIRDFYRFAALFSDLKEKGAYNLSGGFTPENLAEEMIFASPEQEQRMKEFDALIAALRQEAEAVTDAGLAAGRAEWEKATLAAAEAGALAWSAQRPIEAVSPAGTPLAIEEDKSIVPGGINPEHDRYEVTIPAPLERITAVRLEVIQDARFPGDEVSRGGSAFFVSEIEVLGASAPGGPFRPLRLVASRASSRSEAGYPPAAAIDGDPNTALSFVRKVGGGVALQLAEPFGGGPEARLMVKIHGSKKHRYQHLGRFRLGLHSAAEPDAHPESVPDPVLKALRVAAEKRTAAEAREIATYYRTVAPALAGLQQRLTAAVNARDYLALAIPALPVSKSVEPRPIRVLARANWMDDSGEIVEPGVPGFMRQLEPAGGGRASRLDLANWLVAADNPLTARTFVNRLWRIYFGAGLTRTLDDLGSQGDWPTHPELLDWLAVEFRESGWDVKHMVELIVTSRTYRQSSQAAPEVVERDPLNRLLARQARFRIEAELVRDNALAISGLLAPKVGGESARPYQPEGYYSALNFPKREYVPDHGEGLYRRGVYTHWQRTFLHPSLAAFDAPAREECTANRALSNTPLQALVLLNDPTYVEAARVLAERILREGGWTFRGRLRWAFERAVSRRPTPAEEQVLQGLYREQRGRYRADEASARALTAVGAAPVAGEFAPADLAAWTAVTRAILNLHETITRN